MKQRKDQLITFFVVTLSSILQMTHRMAHALRHCTKHGYDPKVLLNQEDIYHIKSGFVAAAGWGDK